MHSQTSPLLSRVHSAFEMGFGRAPDRVVRAPGRVNLIGEHTDYNGGFVLPCAIDYQTMVAAGVRNDAWVRVLGADMGGVLDEFRIDSPIVPRADMPWANYVRGMVQTLMARGWTLGGADLVVAGNVPQGAGLSSSASLEVAVGQAFKSLFRLDGMTQVELALMAQHTENHFVGCNCGIMDQLISAQGAAGHALLIDCRSLESRPVHLPDDLAVVIVHSKVQRGLVDSEYNTRRRQCEAAARHYGVPALRDVSEDRLLSERAGLDELTFRRARHIVTENRRTLEAAEALARNDLSRMGELMMQSHLSMRDDFEITVPPIDRLAGILNDVVGEAGGARMTGGGFGGCVVALMPESLVDEARRAVSTHYRAPNGEQADVHVCHASAGAESLVPPYVTGSLPVMDSTI